MFSLWELMHHIDAHLLIPPVIVATPGRLWELMHDNDAHLSDLSHLSFLVLDEADRMVQLGHYPELTNILELIPQPGDLKKDTYDNDFEEAFKKDTDRNRNQPARPRQARCRSSNSGKILSANVTSPHAPSKGAAETELLTHRLTTATPKDTERERNQPARPRQGRGRNGSLDTQAAHDSDADDERDTSGKEEEVPEREEEEMEEGEGMDSENDGAMLEDGDEEDADTLAASSDSMEVDDGEEEEWKSQQTYPNLMFPCDVTDTLAASSDSTEVDDGEEEEWKSQQSSEKIVLAATTPTIPTPTATHHHPLHTNPNLMFPCDVTDTLAASSDSMEVDDGGEEEEEGKSQHHP
eukprot:gene25417-11076_t